MINDISNLILEIYQCYSCMLPCEVLSIYCIVYYGDCAYVQPNAHH